MERTLLRLLGDYWRLRDPERLMFNPPSIRFLFTTMWEAFFVTGSTILVFYIRFFGEVEPYYPFDKISPDTIWIKTAVQKFEERIKNSNEIDFDMNPHLRYLPGKTLIWYIFFYQCNFIINDIKFNDRKLLTKIRWELLYFSELAFATELRWLVHFQKTSL